MINFIFVLIKIHFFINILWNVKAYILIKKKKKMKRISLKQLRRYYRNNSTKCVELSREKLSNVRKRCKRPFRTATERNGRSSIFPRVHKKAR